MKRYTKRVINFDKQFDKQFDKMFDMFDMFKMFKDNTVTEQDNKTIIKKGDNTYVIDKDGNVTINGKKAVVQDTCYEQTANSCYTKTAAECNADKITLKLPADARVHETLESDMEVISRGELNRVIHENDIKFTNIYWYIGLGCLMVFGLTTFINCLVCKCYFAQ